MEESLARVRLIGARRDGACYRVSIRAASSVLERTPSFA
jgi:hypothetical protein